MKINLFTIPNLITLSNLSCGVASIYVAMTSGDLKLAFLLIVIAAVCDFFDGFAARLLHQYSAIGVQLDSLADMVSFGTAPAFAMYVCCSSNTLSVLPQNGAIVAICCIIPFLTPAFSALRLAKFNIDDSQHHEFEGLTTTANGIFSTALAAACFNGQMLELLAATSIITSLLLISPIRMFSFKMQSYGWKANRLRYVFLIVAAVSFVAIGLLYGIVYAVPVIIVMYILLSTIIWIKKSFVK